MATGEKNSTADAKMEERQSEMIMERLRSKAAHLKPWTESIKAYRLALLDKRHAIDSTERAQIQKCLDSLQKSIKVTTLQAMVERLESITRQLRKRNFDDCSLKFTAMANGTDCFISSDMFYVEVLLESNGSVKDVKIAHHGDPISCDELTQVLRNGDFAEFTSHLEGLASIYQLNADKKQKSKVYLALQALETDLSMLAQLQSSINEPSNLVHKSPVGILQPRKGGHPMKLTYFISPYDLLDMETKSSIPLTVDTVIERQLGQYVTICIESSTSHKLQTQSLMSISRTNDGKSLPSFAAPSNLNSTTLPASFVLKLATPIPITTALVKKIQAVTCIECADMSTSQPLLSLITQLASKGEMDCNNNKGLFVVLPDQHHCYFLNGSPDLQGVMVSSIPFTHPTHVPQILVFLRQQMLFNVLISSCIRTGSKQDLETALMFEVTALSWLHVSVSFEHPLEESMATAEFDLSDITNVKCKLYTMCSDASICSDEYASKVVQRCLSIPVTMRAVIRKAQGQQKRANQQNEDLYVTMVMGNSGKFPNNSINPAFSEGSNNQGSNGNAKFVSDYDVKLGRSGNRASDCQSISKLDVLNSNVGSSSASSASSYNLPSPDMATTPLGLDSQGYIESSPAHGDLFPLSTDRGTGLILTGNHFGQGTSAQVVTTASVSGKTSASIVTINSGQRQLVTVSSTVGGHVVPKSRKERGKRKAMSEGNSPRSQIGRSPKRKHSEDDMGKDLPHSDLESGGPAPTSMSLPLGMELELSVNPSRSGSSGGSGVDSSDNSAHLMKIPAALEGIVKYESMSSRSNSDISMGGDHLIHRTGGSGSSSSSSSLLIMEKGVTENASMDSDFFNSGSQNRSSTGEFTFKSEPIDFETEVLNNQNSSFDDSLIESGDEFNLEQLGINSSIITTKVTSTNSEKNKEVKRLKKIKLEIPSKGGDKELGSGNDGDAKRAPPPVILDIISSQLKLAEKVSTNTDLNEKRPSVEIIPIGNVNTTTSSTSLLAPGLKIVNTSLKSMDSKLKREFRKGLGMGERSDKKSKGDAKRERKRKHLELMANADEKPSKLVALSITPLPPQPATSIGVEKSMTIVSKPSEPSIPKSITLSVKPIPPASSSSVSGATTKTTTTTSIKKPQLPVGTTASPTKTVSILKTPQQGTKSKQSVKPGLSVGKSSQISGLESKNVSSSGSKVTISPLKVHSKVKSSSGAAKSSSMLSSEGKVCTKPATVKLKHLNIPSSTTVTPITKSITMLTSTLTSPTSTTSPVTFTALTQSGSSSSTPTTPVSTSAPKLPITVSPSVSLVSTTIVNTSSSSSADSNGGGNGGTACSGSNNSNNNNSSTSKLNKSVIRSRKGSLSAVIDKLTRQTGGDSQSLPGERSKSESGMDSKKDCSKELLGQKSSDKPKTASGLDQKMSEKKPEYAVKQSSQGIKLTVTKTRSTEGSTKLSSSLKTSAKTSSASVKTGNAAAVAASAATATVSPSTSRPVQSGSATGLKPGVNSGPASKKLTASSNKGLATGTLPNNSMTSSSSSNSPATPIKSSSSSSSAVLKTSSSQPTYVSSSKTSTTSTVKSSQKHTSDGKGSTSGGSKVSERTSKSSSSHDGGSRPSTPKLEKVMNQAVPTSPVTSTSMPPPPPPPPAPLAADLTGQSRKSDEDSSGRPVRQSPKHSQPEETEAERKFRQLLTQTKIESSLTGTTTVTNSALISKPSVNSTHSGSSGVSICSTGERPEGSRTPKQDLPDKSPKQGNSDGRSTPKTPTAEKLFNFNSSTNPGSIETKRPSTPKSLDIPSKVIESPVSVPKSPVELTGGNKVLLQQVNPSIVKPIAKRQPEEDDLSSPEDSLIIDYPNTPHQKSPEKKAKCTPMSQESTAAPVVATAAAATTTQTKSPASPAIALMRSPAGPSPGIKSPLVIGTPHSDHSNPSSVARSSPCVIDDDLMDEALVGVGK